MIPLLLATACHRDEPPPPTPTTSAPTASECAELCDDGLACSTDACDDLGRCIHLPERDCPWPASLAPDVTALAPLDEELRISLSGATWNAADRGLWVVRGDGATAWRLVEDGAGFWAIDEDAAEVPAKWDLGAVDLESLTLPDPVGQPGELFFLVELAEQIRSFDLSRYGEAVELALYDTSPYLPVAGTAGAEALAFVPDEALAEWGFVDDDGEPRTSAGGFGGLFFVGHQNGGRIYVFDLSRSDQSVELVGTYSTEREDTSALEFDAGTGRLYIWHDDDFDDLEVTRLSSSDIGKANRKLDTEYVFDFPGDANIEGMALMGVEDCAGAGRPLFFTIDDGGDRALDVYPDWPLCGP